MGKLQLHYDKTLKLTNALIKIIDLSEMNDFQSSVIQLENYIKSKGYNPIGPLIQKIRTEIDEKVNCKWRYTLSDNQITISIMLSHHIK